MTYRFCFQCPPASFESGGASKRRTWGALRRCDTNIDISRVIPPGKIFGIKFVQTFCMNISSTMLIYVEPPSDVAGIANKRTVTSRSKNSKWPSWENMAKMLGWKFIQKFLGTIYPQTNILNMQSSEDWTSFILSHQRKKEDMGGSLRFLGWNSLSRKFRAFSRCSNLA